MEIKYESSIVFDAAFDGIAQLERYPWVGNKYVGSNFRPLLIGESHYATDENGDFSQDALEELKDKNGTRGIVETVIKNKCDGKTTWNMYEGLIKTFVQETPKNVKDFWTKVAFYNFIQRVVLSKDEPPKIEDKAIAWKCLAGIVKILKPTDIIMFGIRNWEGHYVLDEEEDVVFDGWTTEKLKINGASPAYAKMTVSGEVIPMTIIKHPAKFYSSDQWNKYLNSKTPALMNYLADK